MKTKKEAEIIFKTTIDLLSKIKLQKALGYLPNQSVYCIWVGSKKQKTKYYDNGLIVKYVKDISPTHICGFMWWLAVMEYSWINKNKTSKNILEYSCYAHGGDVIQVK